MSSGRSHSNEAPGKSKVRRWIYHGGKVHDRFINSARSLSVEDIPVGICADLKELLINLRHCV